MKKSRRSGSPRRALASHGNEMRPSCRILSLQNGWYMAGCQFQPDLLHDVAIMGGCWRCSCAYHMNEKGRRCRHTMTVQQETENIREADHETITIGKPPVQCTGCDSGNCRHRRERKRKRGCILHRYVCNNYGKKFTHRPGLRRHYNEDAIITTLDDMCMGKPLKAAQSLERKGMRPDASSMWRWANHWKTAQKDM